MSGSDRATSFNQPLLATSRTRLVLGFLVIYVLWGSTYLAIRWGVETIPPFLMGAVRFLVAGSLLYAYSRMRGAPAPTALQWRSSAIVGVLLLVVANSAVTWAEQRVSSGMTSLLVATVPLWLVLCELAQGTRPGVAKWAGVVLGLVGVALLVVPTRGDVSSAAVEPVGAIVLVIGSLSWTIGSLYSRTAALAQPASLAISMQMLAGGAIQLLIAFATGEVSHLNRDAITMTSIYSLMYLIVFGSLIGFSTYMWLLRVATPTAVGTYAYVNPVVAVVLGALFAGEHLPPQAFVAMLVIVSGVAMVSIGGGGRAATTVDARRET